MIQSKYVLAAALIALPVTGAYADDPAAGANTFKMCVICHDIGETAKNKVGPQLNGLDGRHSGSAAGYNYSDANKKSGITWSKETFEKYITDPKAMVPGTKMIFPGIKNDTERDNLWAYISQFGQDGQKK